MKAKTNAFEIGMSDDAVAAAAATGIALGFIETRDGRNLVIGCNPCDYMVRIATARHDDAELLDAAVPLAFLSAVRCHCSHIQKYFEERRDTPIGQHTGGEWLFFLAGRQSAYDVNEKALATAKPKKRKRDDRRRQRRVRT